MAARVCTVAAGVAGVVALLAGPASAHVEVEADKLQAGASNVKVSFNAESESTTAGIASLRVVLPDGIAPSDVRYVSGPSGWKLTPGADGYTVSGPAVPVGRDAAYVVTIAQFPPTATTLSFRTLQTYSDRHVDRWIEIPEPGQAEPDNPAPTLKLRPAAAAPTTAAASPTTPATQPTPPSPVDSTTPAAAASDEDGGSSAWVWILVAVVVVALAGGGWWLWHRRAGGT